MALSCYLLMNEFAAYVVKQQSVTVVGIGLSLAQFENSKNEKRKITWEFLWFCRLEPRIIWLCSLDCKQLTKILWKARNANVF